MNRKTFFLIYLIIFSFIIQLRAQTDTAFWLAVPEINNVHVDNWNYPSHKGAPGILRFSTFDLPSTVKVYMPADPSFTPLFFNIPANTTYSYEFWRPDIFTDPDGFDHTNEWCATELTGSDPNCDDAANWCTDLDAIENMLASAIGNKTNKGIKIESSNIITCYFEWAAQANREIIALKGKNALGTDFYVPFQTYLDNRSGGDYDDATNYSGIYIVATEDATNVSITPTKDIWINGVGVKPANVTYNVPTMDKGQVFVAVPYGTDLSGAGLDISKDNNDRLAGTRVTSNRPIAVETNDGLINEGSGVDIVADQLVPTSLINTEYVVVRGKLNGAPDWGEEIAYILATQDNTEIFVGGTSETTLDAGEQYLYRLRGQDAFFISTNDDTKPFYVLHVSGAFGQVAGAILPPINDELCTGSFEVSINRSVRKDWADFYLMVVVRLGAEGGFTVDGDATVLTAGDFDPIPGTTDWLAACIEYDADVNDPVRVKNSINMFHLGQLMGMQSRDAFYGYFSDYNSNSGSAVSTKTRTYIDADHCLGDTLNLRATGGVSYLWSCATDNSIDDATLAIPTIVPQAGLHKFDVTIDRTCYDDTTMTVYVKIDSVNSYFEIDNTITSCCSPFTSQFNNLSFGDLDYYYWDFSDGTISMDETPPAKLMENNSYQTDTLFVGLTVGKNCYDYYEDTVLVYPKITAKISKTAKSGCQQDVTQGFAVDTTGAGPFEEAEWNFGDGTAVVNVIRANSADTIYHLFQNLNNYDTTYYITLTLIDFEGSCNSTVVDSVFVPGKARARFSIQNKKGCSPLTIDIANNSKGDVTYEWWFTDYDMTQPADLTTNFATYSHTYPANTSAVPDTNYVSLRITKTNDDASICEDTYGPDTIVVYPEFASCNINTDIVEGCNPLLVNITQTTSPNIGTTHYWDFGDGTSSGLLNPGNKTYTNTTSSDVTHTIQLRTVSDYNCEITAAPVDVTVYAYLDANFTVSPDTVGCSPLSIVVQNNTSSNSAANYTWDLDGETETTDDTNPFTITYDNQTGVTYTRDITLSNTNGHAACDISFIKEITVYPEITADFSMDASLICHNSAVQFTNASIFTGAGTSIDATTSTVSFYWEFGDGTSSDQANPAHTFKNTQNNGILTQDFTVTLTITVNGCQSTYSEVIQVYPKITPQFNSNDYTVCAPEDVVITNASTGADSYLWEFSDGGLDETTTNVTYNFTNTTFNTIQTTTVILTATNDICSKTITKNYTVYPELIANFSPDETEGCAPLNLEFTNNSTGGVLSNGDLIVDWNFDDGDLQSTIASTVGHTFDNKSSADIQRTVKLVIENSAGCKDSTTVDIEVWPEIDADFTFSKDGNCAPSANEVTIENTSINGSNFDWDFGFSGETDNTTDHSPITKTFVHTNADLNAKDVYTITLVATDANHSQCTDTKTRQITIYPPIVPAFNITENEIGCSPLTSTFDNTSTGYQLRYIWDYGDGNTSSSTSGTHQYRNLTSTNTAYNVTLVAIDSLNCSDNVSGTVTVYPEVVADFTFTREGECTPFPVEFSYPETAINGSRWEWNFGDGTATLTDDIPRETFQHTFDNAGATIDNYQMQLIAADDVTGCADTITKSIEVYPRLIPAFVPDVTEGCNPLTVNFDNQTTGLANYNWDFKDGQSSSLEDPQHVFSHLSLNDKDYIVTLTTVQENTGCTKDISNTITAYSYVNASFGLAKIDAEKASKSDVVGGCHPFNIEIVDSSKTNGTWAWDFGDGGTGIMQQPGERTYLNTDNTMPLEETFYEVKLQVTNTHNCFDRDSIQLQVYPRSVPDFSVENEGCHPHKVYFDDESVIGDGTRYFWRLGDGSTKVGDSFSYTYLNYSYTEIDTFFVNLRTTTEYGCADSITQTIIVRPSPSAELVPVNDRGCPPFRAYVENRSQGVNLTHTWKMYENASTFQRSNLTTEPYTYYNNNMNDEILTYYPVLSVENEFGCSDIDTAQIFVFPNVLVGFTPKTREGCSPLSVEFVNNSNASAKIFEWEFGDSQNSGSKNPTHIYYNETVGDVVYTVKLHAESEFGCFADYEDTIAVYLTPIVDFETKDPVQLFPETVVTFKNLTQPGPWTHTWNFGNNDQFVKQSLADFDYDFQTWGPKDNDFTYLVTLHVTSGQCEAEKSHNVKIIAPVPTVNIEEITPPAGCEPHTATFRLYQENGATWEWDFGNGDTSNDSTVTYTFDTAGFYNIKLTVFGDGGLWYDYNIVEVYPKPEASFIVSPELVMLPDQEIQTYNTTENGDKFYWDFGDGSAVIIDESPSFLYTSVEGSPYTITLIAESEDHCMDTAIVESAVEVDGTGAIEFPNAFLPNDASPSDGSYDPVDITNNVFHPVYYGIRSFEMWIFNRWGEQIFYTNDIQEGWNGKFGNNGKKLGQDVYFWKAKGKYENGVAYKKSGDVTLIIK